jgi:CubicO group peptidase (beta-lactamase class C family)
MRARRLRRMWHYTRCMVTSVSLPRATPESCGIASTAIHAYLDAIQQQVRDIHSVMLLRHGRVIAEGWCKPYAADYPHVLYSLTKSFTSTAIGLMVAENRLTLDDSILTYFPDEAPTTPDPLLTRMRVRHLLSMSTGHAVDTTPYLRTAPDHNWARMFFSVPVTHEPGSFFLYNTGATYMLAALVHKLTGLSLIDYLTPRLFEPLGIHGVTSEYDPRGIQVGGWGFKMTTEDIARFGQLYLQQGRWHGQQLLPTGWVAEASAKHVSNGTDPLSDWAQGYGFQFWRCQHNHYRGDGAFGQYCVVMPDCDAVLVITGGVTDMQLPLTLAWQHLLPAMQPAPRVEDPAAQQTLRSQLASLEIAPQAGSAVSDTGKHVSGRVYHFADNPLKITSICFDFDSAMPRCTVIQNGRPLSWGVGHGHWTPARGWFDMIGAVTLLRPVLEHTAVSGAWHTPDTFTQRICFTEAPFIGGYACTFEGDTVALTVSSNVDFLVTPEQTLIGQSG